MPVTAVRLDAVQVLAVAALGVAVGAWLKRRVRLLDRLHIPASVLGGLLWALLVLLLRDRWLNVEMDMALRDILMVAFFTSVGMSARLQLISRGGRQVLVFWLLATGGAVLQNALGIGLAVLLRLDPLIGVVCGSVSMTGGPATALAFGATFEQMGLAGATTLGIAAAMFGITSSGLLGGFAGGHIIERQALRLTTANNREALVHVAQGGEVPEPHASLAVDRNVAEQTSLLGNVVAIAVAMGLGTLLSMAIERAGVVLPAYVGAMVAAALLRNLDDRLHFARIAQPHVEEIANVALNLFIVMALLTLRLWELVHLAAPVLLILTAQVALTWLLAARVSFPVMGRDYDSAIMSAGYVGFMIGTTANALACMQVLTEKYGPAVRAVMIVSLVGAFLIDFTNALVITVTANLLR
jgi:ESS family glutamate:Na+ symporter